ncbi:MAG: sigma-70 family RNA polymerase sigma factor [Actinomycetota bacterium]
MQEQDWLTERFEENRPRLRGVAYRMLGSLSEADDAVQEAWLRLRRADTSDVQNLGGWLTTVVARVSLDMLRSRKSRREEPLTSPLQEPRGAQDPSVDPEQEALLADTVGLALLVVLEKLAPAERLAFVLHDMFAVPFEEIAPIVGRSSTTTRQLASRARRRVQGAPEAPSADIRRQREVVEAFLTAARGGDFEALLAVLDPDVVHRADRVIAPPNGKESRGSTAVANGAVAYSRYAGAGQPAALLVLVDGAVGVAVAPHGRLLRVATFKVVAGKIAEINVIADPERLRTLDLSLLDD